jgi:hypothetical protein
VTGSVIIAEAPARPGSLAIPRRRPHVLPSAPDLRGLRAADRTTLDRPTIAAIIARYLEWKAGTAAKHTSRTYTDGIRHFGEFLSMSGINAFEETAEVLPASILEEWIVWCRKRPMHRSGRPLGPASVQTYFYAVSDCFKWAARRKLLPERFRWAEMAANAAESNCTPAGAMTRDGQRYKAVPPGV